MCCTRLAENAGLKKSPKSGHLGTIATKARINSLKKLVKQQYLLHMSSQYGALRPTSGWDRSGSLGTPANFNGFRVLAALVHGTVVVGVSQTLRRWTEGATCIGQGGHHVGHWPTFLVYFFRGRGAKYCGVIVCMSVCLTVCPLASLKDHTSKRHEIFCTCC